MLHIEGIVLDIAGSAWVLPLLFVFTVVDGFFPPLPSESIVVALAAIAAGGDPAPELWALAVVAGLGAWGGDQIAYSIGRRSDVTRFRIFSRPRVRNIFDYAQRMLNRRGASLIFSARYIPVGRVAVNMTAGTLRYPYRRFAVLSAVTAACWALYSVGIGLVSAWWVNAGPLVNAVVGIVGGFLIGALVDLIVMRRRGERPYESESGDAQTGTNAGALADGREGLK